MIFQPGSKAFAGCRLYLRNRLVILKQVVDAWASAPADQESAATIQVLTS